MSSSECQLVTGSWDRAPNAGLRLVSRLPHPDLPLALLTGWGR